jgi:hypothetical protein
MGLRSMAWHQLRVLGVLSRMWSLPKTQELNSNSMH